MALCAADVTKPPQPPTDGSSGSRFLRHTTSAELEDYMNEEMTPDYMTGTPNTVCADARRQFSRIGLMFLVGTALIYGVQFGASAIANAINPDLLSSTSYALLIVMIPMYVIAMPIMALLIKRIPAVTLPKKHMTFGQWLIAFLMCYGAMYVSNYTGLILTQLISILKGSPVTNTMLEVATSSNLWVNLFIMVLCAPVAEELIFRKLLIDRLAQYGEGRSCAFLRPDVRTVSRKSESVRLCFCSRSVLRLYLCQDRQHPLHDRVTHASELPRLCTRCGDLEMAGR